VEKGYYADIIAVKGNPLQNIKDVRKVCFVMKEGAIVRNDPR
jgi:imidazolonepropionase-like amidohydrolase